jgi:hypothetical protein
VFKVTNAILISAVIATFVTGVPGWNTGLVASPMPDQSAIKACTEQAWPYLNCVGTPYGNPRVRLIEIK